MKKILKSLFILALACAGVVYAAAEKAENVPSICEDVPIAESAVAAVEEVEIESGKDIAEEKDTGPHIMENPIEKKNCPVEKIAETADATTVTEENKLCVGLAKEIYEETNRERIAAGLPELAWSDELAEAANIRAVEIIDKFDHVRPDGTKCYALHEKIHGENIARGPQATGAEYVERWMESPGHRANILDERYTIIGVGSQSTEMGNTGVQLFGF